MMEPGTWSWGSIQGRTGSRIRDFTCQTDHRADWDVLTRSRCKLCYNSEVDKCLFSLNVRLRGWKLEPGLKLCWRLTPGDFFFQNIRFNKRCNVRPPRHLIKRNGSDIWRRVRPTLCLFMLLKGSAPSQNKQMYARECHSRYNNLLLQTSSSQGVNDSHGDSLRFLSDFSREQKVQW